MTELRGKTIAITGGTKGVGKAAALEFARLGADVTIGGRDTVAAKEIMQIAQAFPGKVTFQKVDLHDADECRSFIDASSESSGRLDGLFCYAGVTPISPLDECDVATFDEVMTVNFKACFFCCQQAIAHMIDNGGGSIVLTGSAHAWGGQRDRAAYACSKGALLTLMEHIAHNYATEGIRCNCLVLGWTPTEGELTLRKSQGEGEGELRKRAASVLPMGRMLEPCDYMGALTYLMSDNSSMMTGSMLRITAGEYI